MKTFSLIAGTLFVVVAIAAPAAAQGRGTPPSTATTASQGRGNPPTTTAPVQKAPKTPTPLTVPPSVATKVTPLLPPGTDLATASTGFKNLGQFIAAAHVSNNLSIPFDSLKGKMTGKPAESLGQAIHDLKPDVNSANEVKKAEKQAKSDQSGKH
jgi:hypothetical protein